MCVRWGGVSGLQWIQVEDFIGPDVRNELQDRRTRGGGGRGLLTLNSVSDSGDGRRAPPVRDDSTRHQIGAVSSLNIKQLHHPH